MGMRRANTVLVIVRETVLKLIPIFGLVFSGESAGTHIDWLHSYPVGSPRFTSVCCDEFTILF